MTKLPYSRSDTGIAWQFKIGYSVKQIAMHNGLNRQQVEAALRRYMKEVKK